MANQQEPINVGLNLQGNALGSVNQLTQHMIALRDIAKSVGDQFERLNNANKNGDVANAATLKRLRQQMDLMVSSPQSVTAKAQLQHYSNLSNISRANQVSTLVNSNLKFQDPRTMSTMFAQFDQQVLKQALKTRLDVANLNGDIKKIKAAEQALIQYKNTLKNLNNEFKGLDYIKRQSDASIQSMMQMPAGQLALQRSIQARNLNQFGGGARESAVQKYMTDPSRLVPANRDYTNTNADQIRKDMQANASKMAAAQRLMGQLYLQDPAKNPQVSQQLNQYSQMLAKLEEEKTRLQAIQNLRRANLRTTDEQIQKLRQVNDATKVNQRLTELTNGGLRVNTLSTERIAQLSPDNLIARQMTMTKRLSQAKEVMFQAESLGNTKAKKEAEALAIAYQKELDLIKARNREINNANRPNSFVTRLNDMNTGESSGALLGMQGLLMRNYMLWGAFMGSITGSYAFLRDFELALKQTQAISQATDTQMIGLKQSILEVGENSRFSAIEITEAATTLAQAGFSLAEIQKTLQSVTLLATATGSSLKETVDIATASLGAFQLSADNMPKIVNQITQAMNLSKLDIQKFQLAVQYAGNAASDAGLNFEELLASVSTVANAGVRSGSTLGTGFRQLLTDLISPSQKFEKILARLGLTTADIDVRTNGLVGSLKKLREAGFTTADAYESFEVRSVAFYTALANNIDTYDNLTANLDNNTAAMEANEIQMNSLGAQTDRMFNQFKAFAEVSGEGIRNNLTILFHTIGDITTELIELTNNGFIKGTIQAVALGVALSSTVVIMRGMLGAVIGLMAALKTTGATFALTTPYIFAIGLAIAGVITIIQKFTTSSEKMKNAVEDSKTSFNNLKDSATSLQGGITEVTNKLTSLESRFESIKNDPAALAVEMSNLRTKAMELGVTLETDLNGSIESVKKGWQELRIELGKELEMNLDRQVSELRNLSALTAQMRAEEAIKNKPDSLGAAAKGGYGLIYDAYNLKNQIGLAPVQPRSFGPAFQLSTEKDFNRKATSLDVFNEAAKFGGKGAPTGAQMNQMLEALHQDLSTPQSTDVILKKAPEWTKQANQLLTTLNHARDGYLKAANNTAVSAEARQNARTSADSVTNLAKTVQEIQTYLNSISQPLIQAESMSNQAKAQGYTNQLNTELTDGSFSQKHKVNWGKALSVVDPKKSKAIKSENLRFLREELMPYVNEAAALTGLPPEYIISHMAQESGISKDKSLLGKNPDGSTTSAVGLMQVTKAAAKDVGVGYNTISNDYRANIIAGAKYLKQMKDATDGTLYSGSRAYYMGIGNWQAEKTKGSNSRSGEANEYAKGIFSTVNAVQKGNFGNVVLQQNGMPKELANNVTQGQQLKSYHDFVMAELSMLPKDVNKMSEEQKTKYKDLIAQEKALADKMADVSASVNNSLRSARAEQDQIRKSTLENLNEKSELLQNEITATEAQLKDKFDPEVDNNLKAFNEKQKQLFDKAKDLRTQQAKLKTDMEQLQAADYGANSTDFVISPAVAAIAKIKLDRELNSISTDIEQKRKAQLKESSKAFADLIKKQNTEFVDSFKNELQDLDEPYQDALTVNSFNKQKSTWKLEDDLGLTDMRNRRASMEDPRFKNQFTDAERNDLDLAIQAQASRVDEVNQNYLMAERDITLQQIKKVEDKLTEYEVKFREFETQQNLNLTQNLSGTELEALKTAQDKEMNKVSREIQKQKNDLLSLQEKARNINNTLEAASADNPADRYNMSDTFKSLAKSAVRNDNSAAGYERDIQSTIGGINSAFNNLINTAIEASDNVDDFFKIITGGSGESREAFKAFGYEIISTIAKVVQNRLVNKFVDMMISGIFGGSPTSSSAALSGQMMGQNASSANNGSGWWQTGLSSLVQAGVGAFSGWYGGLGATSAAGVRASGATTYGVGADYFNSGITSQSVVNNTGGMIPMASGGEIVGGVPNKDSVPILGMPKEYILPTSTTEVVGKDFLSGLKKDPHGMMDAIKGNNLANRPQINKSVQSNIYMVAPQAIPSSIGPNDIVVAVSDNISRNGELKQLIKQVQAE